MIDIGSTFTKACSVDLLNEKVLATVQTPSTTDKNVSEGIERVLQLLESAVKESSDYKIRLACSSAAGGLRMVVIGLVPELTVKAGKLSAYNAGAKIVGAYSYKLNENEIKEIDELNPDIILFVGGTDGGDEKTLLWNANIMTQLKIYPPIIFAGNKVVAGEVKSILDNSGKDVIVTENVLARLNQIQTLSVKEKIRKLFIKRITFAKGIDQAKHYVDDDIIPTPLAVFNAIKLLSSGTANVDGIGELIAIDLGGATTDVYSSASGDPNSEGTTLKGLPLPYDMRTVEGDLGLRINALSTLKEANLNKVVQSSKIEKSIFNSIVEKISNDITIQPKNNIEKIADLELASYAIQIALKRHVGYLEKQYTPVGEIYIQYGKDLTNINTVLCTGGLFPHANESQLLEVLNRSICNKQEPFSLKPKRINCFIDNEYILYGMGLLSLKYPDKALRILKRKLKQIS